MFSKFKDILYYIGNNNDNDANDTNDSNNKKQLRITRSKLIKSLKK